MRWFGESWGAPVNDETQHVPTPVGSKCYLCTKPITESSVGFAFPVTWEDEVLYAHRGCLMNAVLGPSEFWVS